MSPDLPSKLPETGTTIFTEMSSLAIRYNAVNLGQGFPDFHMDERLVALVNEAMLAGHNQYAHAHGDLRLREVIAAKVTSLYACSVDPVSQLTITPGGTYAIYTAITSVLNAGDEVIIFEPAYDSYTPNIILNGGIPVRIPLKFPDFSIDWKMVRAKVNGKTRMIILNSPHNPTGAILQENDIAELKAIVAGTDIVLVSDEVYEHLVFDALPHLSMLRYPELAERSFVCFSFGKTYHCTGWKLGYCIAPPSFMYEFRKVHQFNCFSCFTPAQVALAKFLEDASTYLHLNTFIQSKRDLFAEHMTHSRFTPLPSNGSYFQLYSYARISDEPEKEFALRLVKDFGIAAIPVSAFYARQTNQQLLRFCFAKKDSTLETAAERLRKI